MGQVLHVDDGQGVAGRGDQMGCILLHDGRRGAGLVGFQVEGGRRQEDSQAGQRADGLLDGHAADQAGDLKRAVGGFQVGGGAGRVEHVAVGGFGEGERLGVVVAVPGHLEVGAVERLAGLVGFLEGEPAGVDGHRVGHVDGAGVVPVAGVVGVVDLCGVDRAFAAFRVDVEGAGVVDGEGLAGLVADEGQRVAVCAAQCDGERVRACLRVGGDGCLVLVGLQRLVV